MTRRNSVITAMASILAAVAGRRIVEAQEPITGTEAIVDTSPRSWTTTGISSPVKSGYFYNMDQSTGITLELAGEKIHLSPEEIMEALREKK